MMLFAREQLEADEARRLAPYGMKSRDSRGRKFSEAKHPFRTANQRNRDRIVHATAFRRLEYKTQVFVNSEGDYYRTPIEQEGKARTVREYTAGMTDRLAFQEHQRLFDPAVQVYIL